MINLIANICVPTMHLKKQKILQFFLCSFPRGLAIIFVIVTYTHIYIYMYTHTGMYIYIHIYAAYHYVLCILDFVSGNVLTSIFIQLYLLKIQPCLQVNSSSFSLLYSIKLHCMQMTHVFVHLRISL